MSLTTTLGGDMGFKTDSQEVVLEHPARVRRSRSELVVGCSGSEPVVIRRPMFLRSLGETGSGRSIALMGLAEQTLVGGGAVLWVDSGSHPRVVAALQKLADKHLVNYAASSDFSRGDQAAIASLMALGGVGHCVPAHVPPADTSEDEYARSRIGNILRSLSDSELNGWGNTPPTLIVFNQVVGAYEGRAMGLGSLPARLRGGGHSMVFSDTAIMSDALDVAAHVRQYLFHRMHYAHARHLVESLRPAYRQKVRSSISAFFAQPAEDDSEILARQVSQLVDDYAVYCANGDWTLLKAAAPTLYGRSRVV